MPGTTMAGSVLERSRGGGWRGPLTTASGWAAAAAAAAAALQAEQRQP